MDVKLTMDNGPILTQLFAINAKIEALADLIATTDEQKDQFNKSYEKHFKMIVNSFDKQFPGVIDENPFQ